MTFPRSLLILPLAGALLVSGCRPRDSSHVAGDESQAEKIRMAAEVENLTQQNESLRSSLEQARDQLKAHEGQGVEHQVKDLLSGDSIAGVYRTERGGIGLDEDFAFAKGSADLNEEGKKTIQKLADKLNKGEYAAAKVIVEGHTDDTPVSRKGTVEKYGDNWHLSAARAAEVVVALQKAGVDAHRLHGAFRGEYDPRVTEGKDKAGNRRVELYLK